MSQPAPLNSPEGQEVSASTPAPTSQAPSTVQSLGHTSQPQPQQFAPGESDIVNALEVTLKFFDRIKIIVGNPVTLVLTVLALVVAFVS